MMREKNDSTFQLGNSDEPSEAIFQEGLQELKIEKLSNKVTLLTILIPVLIGITLVFAYFDIKSRVDRTHNTEATIIEQISKDLETKFSFLSLEQAEIKNIYSKKMPSFEKSIAFMKSDLKDTQSLLKKLDSSSISREEMSQTVKSLNGKSQELSDSMELEIETIKDIRNQMAKDVEDVSSNLYALTESLTKMKDGFDRLNADVSKLSDEKVGKKELGLALKLKNISNQQELLKIKTTLDNRIESLEKQLNKIRSSQGQIVAVQTIKGSKQSKEKSVQPNISPVTIPFPSDGIEEQNIE